MLWHKLLFFMSGYILIFCQIYYFYLKKKKGKKRYKKHTEVIKPGSVIYDINCPPFQVQVANLKKQTEDKTKLPM